MFRVFCVDSGLYHYENLSKDPLHLQKMKFEMPDDKFEEAMQSFIGHILEQDASEGDDPTTEELQSLKEFLIVFIDFTRDSSVMLPGTTRLLKNELQSLFYSYSHRKFGIFLEVPEMRFVMARVLNPEYIGTLISKNPTLNENEDLYRKCAEIILEKVDSHNGENEQQPEA
ncbi:unnamed protein product [Moneuplotes crassus]|uniref:Uncharacterized protein n=1 Tax=Euplotes crassus TaxID=5936 RepID=A0AAD1YCV3_EUPCR|nr:unnamed protein product [Moneuplotes crassus]